MKKYYVLLLFILFSLSCKKDFLEEKAVTTLTQNFYQSAEGLKALVNGTYQVFRFKTDYGQGNFLFGTANDCEVYQPNENFRISSGLYLPDAWGADASASQSPGVFTYALLGTISGNVVEGMYPVINRCNVFLENYPKLDGEERAKVEGNKGEMLFIRAYCYYLLTNVFGDVPLVLNSFAGFTNVFYFPKSPLEDIYSVMISDLTEAVQLLPEETAELGRITKPAAAHFLAQLYLNRAQAAGWKNSPKTHLQMLYKGNEGKEYQDLDSCIYYASIAIDQKSGETAYGGLAPDYGDLWAVAGAVSGNTDYPRDKVSEIILSTQYTFLGEFNGRYGGSQIIHIYDQDYTVIAAGITRSTMEYPRPFRGAGPNDWAYDMYTDRANDSRFWKTYIHSYNSNDNSTSATTTKWTKETAYYYNTYLRSKYPERYNGDSIVAGRNRVEFGYPSLVFIENSKEEPIDSLWLASQPFLLLARWTACSPNGAGYFTYDASGNITGFKPGAEVDPDNPVVTDAEATNRKVRYRMTMDPNFPRYNTDATGDGSKIYMSTAKWWDINRGQGTDPNGNGSIDIPLIRLAETYLIRAEAYGRKGNYSAAISDINVLRRRAAFHPGEVRSQYLVAFEPGVLTGRLEIPDAEKVVPYTVSTDSYDKIAVTGDEWLAGSEKAKLENYPPTVANHPTADATLNRFIHFIYNEKARELIYELKITEDLHNAGILWDRIYYRDYYGAPSSSTGTVDYPFPVDDDDVASGANLGAIGHGRGQFDEHHTFKSWPTAYLDLLTDPDGNALTPQEKADYQNPGY